MKSIQYYSAIWGSILFLACTSVATQVPNKVGAKEEKEADVFISYEVNPQEQDLRFFHKDELGQPFANHGKLRAWLEKRDMELLFAMNGGMYLQDLSPQGLYIEQGKEIKSINKVEEAYGNFYMQPNGIFYITKDKKAVVCSSAKFSGKDEVEYATQSGPMLLIGGEFHPKFREGSSNVHIRNGLGILPNGNVLFVMSKEKVSFYDFASFFKEAGCEYALYLDGFVSRTYLPSKDWKQLDGVYGIIIAHIR